MVDFLDDLSSVQREAVIRTNGPSLIIAGAGSGKTRVLTYRIAYLLLEGVSPGSILALTFTNKAAREMKDRILQVAGKQANRLWMGTFHSVFARILRYEASFIGFTSNFTIYDTSDTASIIRGILKEMNLDDKIYKDRDVHNRISMAKNNLMTPAAYASSSQLISEDMKNRKPRISEIYQKYVAKCRNANAMDFDDLLLYTNILFRDNPDVLAKYQSIFRYVLVDEYQDTNVAQYLIVKRLVETNKNITVVGDDAQSIYSFRGARIENILNFKKDYPDYAEFKLEQNYRSTQTIVNAANSLIAKNKLQIKKTCFSKGDSGEKIDIIKAFTDQEEGILVASSIVDAIFCKHAEYANIAILYRTNAQSRIFEDSLRKRNVPYRIYGGISFYQRAEIKDAIAYMRLAANPQDDEAFKRIINYPARGIGNTTMDRLQKYASDNNLSLWDALYQAPFSSIGIKEAMSKKMIEFRIMIESFVKLVNTEKAYDFASDIIKKSGMLAELKSNKTPEGISRIENIEELLNGIKEYTEGAENPEEDMPITEYLQNVALITDADNNSPDDKNKVSLMTIHSAKGLEFDFVYIVGVEEGLFPGNNTMQSEQSLEEERRLFYVALTRAAVKATISFAQTRYRWGNLTSAIPSRFLRDIDSEYLQLNSVGSESSEDVSQFSQPRFALKKAKPQLTPLISNTESESNSDSNSVVDISGLRPGTEVEHSRFGLGRIVEIEGKGGDTKAKIDFQNAGRKTLLLKFAKLNIVK